jgi:nitrate reductase NapE component
MTLFYPVQARFHTNNIGSPVIIQMDSGGMIAERAKMLYNWPTLYTRNTRADLYGQRQQPTQARTRRKMEILLNDPVFIVLSVALVGTIGYNVWQVIYRNKAWKQVMADTNLKFEEHNGKDRYQTLSGVYHHRQITFADTNLPVQRNGKRRTNLLTNASTNIHIPVENPQGYKLTLHRVSQSKTSIPIGNEEFDNRFNLTCEPEDFGKRLLVSETLRQNLLKLKPGELIELNENELVYDQLGRLTDTARILFLFDLTCSLADAIEAYRA